MTFNSVSFLVFFPIVLIIYFIVPTRLKYVWLLISSYFFYACWNPVFLTIIVISTLISYLSGLIIERTRKGNAGTGIILFLCIFTNIGLLVYFKYSNFLIDIWNQCGIYQLSAIDVLLPVGISYYTFQVIGYSVDVYKGKIPAERNLIHYALFVSFFPKLIAGPIERFENFNIQININNNKHLWNYGRITDGFITMLWGYFMKVVIADRVAVLVNYVFDNCFQFGTVELVAGAVLFAVQLYCDFGGYSLIAVGAARVLGFDLIENFDTPYFSASITEFWRRWHISLSNWLRDYIYIPLGGNRKGKARQYVNIIITFAVSGLWHGANFTYVVWGLIHGAAQVVEKEWECITRKFSKRFDIPLIPHGCKYIKMMITFVVVDFAWIFFRADSVSIAFKYISGMFCNLNLEALFTGSLYSLGLDMKEWHILMFALVLLVIVDLAKYVTGKGFNTLIAEQWIVTRWAILLFLIGYIVLFGCYGPGFDSAKFIYAQF